MCRFPFPSLLLRCMALWCCVWHYFCWLSPSPPSLPIFPFASARQMTICRLHVLFRISPTSTQRCFRPSLFPLRGAYAVRIWAGMFEFLRSIVTLGNLLFFLEICVMYFCVLPCIIIAVAPCIIPVFSFLVAADAMTL